jgi:hypothetical protein
VRKCRSELNAMFDMWSRVLKDDGDHIIAPTDQWKLAFWDPKDIDATVTRVPACLIFFLFLWCIDLFIMDSIQLSYYQVLGIKQSGGSPFMFVAMTAMFFTALYGFNMVSVCQYMGISVEYGVLTFYGFAVLSFAPFVPGHDSRLHFFRVLKQILFPGAKVTFPEVMAADALCSLSKIFKDLGITMVILYSEMYGGAASVTYHNQAMILVAMLASIPYA